ncbi:MAG: DUF4112 domain-containing protein [Alphaproteobacteria bacterium]
MDEATPPLHPETVRRLERLRALARLMDTRFRLPLVPVRFGLDSVIGLVPVVGDTVSWAIAGWIVAEARRLGAPPELVGRMLANSAVDWAVGLVPFAGDLLDVAVRANTRNVALLEEALANGTATPRRAGGPTTGRR